MKIGITVTGFVIQSVSYPEQIARMQEKVASQSMAANMSHYTQMAMADSMTQNTAGSNMAADMAGMQMGMMMGQQMANQMANTMNSNSSANPAPKFCPNCGTPTNGAKFCSNCGQKLI